MHSIWVNNKHYPLVKIFTTEVRCTKSLAKLKIVHFFKRPQQCKSFSSPFPDPRARTSELLSRCELCFLLCLAQGWNTNKNKKKGHVRFIMRFSDTVGVGGLGDYSPKQISWTGLWGRQCKKSCAHLLLFVEYTFPTFCYSHLHFILYSSSYDIVMFPSSKSFYFSFGHVPRSHLVMLYFFLIPQLLP